MKTIAELKNIPCPICGKMPYIHALYDERHPMLDAGDHNEYKIHCLDHHLDCCDWKRTELEAWQLWEKRTTDTTQPDFGYNNNHFTIQNLTVDEMASLLYRWHKDAADIMRTEGEITAESIAEWLKKPVDGIYPKGYPNAPLELQSQETDVYRYRKLQARYKI